MELYSYKIATFFELRKSFWHKNVYFLHFSISKNLRISEKSGTFARFLINNQNFLYETA